MISAERLRELLFYDPRTGLWARRKTIGRHGCFKAGEPVGYRNPSGYLSIRIDGKLYLAHRLAFLYMTGQWPNGQVDHRNLCPDDNSWINLRTATHGQNVQNSSLRKNNTSGKKGAHIIKGKYQLSRPYRARITINKKEVHLGYFATPKEAHAAYMKAAKQYFGKFARAK